MMESKTIKNLIKLPDCGKIANPYFYGKRETNGTVTEDDAAVDDDTGSVLTPSSTEESGDSLHDDKQSNTKKKMLKKRPGKGKQTAIPPPVVEVSPEQVDQSDHIKESVDEQVTIEVDPQPTRICARIGCPNLAVDDPAWDCEYCSVKCCIEHCRAAFDSWVAFRQSESVATINL